MGVSEGGLVLLLQAADMKAPPSPLNHTNQHHNPQPHPTQYPPTALLFERRTQSNQNRRGTSTHTI